MSLPRTTPHPDTRKVVRIEKNPYQSQHADTLPPLTRVVYDDDTHELFAGSTRVVGFRVTRPNTKSFDPVQYICHLDREDGLSHAIGVCLNEAWWLQESVGRTKQ